MTRAVVMMAIEALFAALVTALLVRIVLLRVKRSARTFTLRDAKGRTVSRFTLGDEDDFISVLEREVRRLEFDMPSRPISG